MGTGLCVFPCQAPFLFSKTLSFRLHRLKHYTFKVLPCQEFERTFWHGWTSEDIFIFKRDYDIWFCIVYSARWSRFHFMLLDLTNSLSHCLSLSLSLVFCEFECVLAYTVIAYFIVSPCNTCISFTLGRGWLFKSVFTCVKQRIYVKIYILQCLIVLCLVCLRLHVAINGLMPIFWIWRFIISVPDHCSSSYFGAF